MVRLTAAVLLCFTLLCVGALGQGPAAPLWPTEVIGESSGGFTFSVRLMGDAKVTFRDVGTIDSLLNSGDTVSWMTRQYHDGVVQRDSRTTTDGVQLPDDGYTSAWSMLFDSQILSDQTGIAFHNYSTVSGGATVDAESGANPGVDLEASRRFGGFGKRMADSRRSGAWGGFLGFGVTDVNAKTEGTVMADLRTLTDIYSLDGATPPTAPYSAPSTESVTVIGPDGTETQVTIDTTTYLANKPLSRVETTDPGAAEIDGYWQVKGAYGSLRAGIWGRMFLSRQLSVRVSAGINYSVLGIQMRYDERLAWEGLRTEIRDTAISEEDTYGILGYFGSLDLELWLTRRTGFFASVTYEDVSEDLAIIVGGRTADIGLASGTGFRFGITTLF